MANNALDLTDQIIVISGGYGELGVAITSALLDAGAWY